MEFNESGIIHQFENQNPARWFHTPAFHHGTSGFVWPFRGTHPQISVYGLAFLSLLHWQSLEKIPSDPKWTSTARKNNTSEAQRKNLSGNTPMINLSCLSQGVGYTNGLLSIGIFGLANMGMGRAIYGVIFSITHTSIFTSYLMWTTTRHQAFHLHILAPSSHEHTEFSFFCLKSQLNVGIYPNFINYPQVITKFFSWVVSLKISSHGSCLWQRQALPARLEGRLVDLPWCLPRLIGSAALERHGGQAEGILLGRKVGWKSLQHPKKRWKGGCKRVKCWVNLDFEVIWSHLKSFEVISILRSYWL